MPVDDYTYALNVLKGGDASQLAELAELIDA